MVYDLMRPLWRFPSFFEDESDWMTPLSSGSGLAISEDEKNVYVEAAVPGLDPKDVDITFEKGLLWIKGQTKEEETDKKRKYYRRSSSSYSYRVAVPGDIDMTKEPEATCKNGVMKVIFTKSPKTQPKKITVKSQ